MRAIAPVTCGVAIDVPLKVAVAVSLAFQVERMADPGANSVKHEPKLEKEERASEVVVEPTVTAVDTRAGEEPQALALLFPAAME